MKRVVNIALVGALAVILAFIVAGCDKTGGITDVDTWKKRLEEAKSQNDAEKVKEAEEALKALTKHWTKLVKDPSRREQSLRQIGYLNSPETIPALMDVWKSDPASRRSIAKILGDIGDPQAGSILVENLKEPTGSISEKNEQNGLNFTILTALSKMGYKPAKEKAIQFLTSDRPDVATAAALCVGKIGELDAKAVEGLKAILLKSGNNWMQAKRSAIVSLGEMKAVGALPEIILNLYQDNGNYYPAASDALFKIGEPAIQPLLDTLNRKNEFVEKWYKDVRQQTISRSSSPEIGKAQADKLYPEGTVEAKVIEVLGDQENPKVAPEVFKIVETLTKKLDKDGTMTMLEGQMCGLAAMAVGRSRDPSYAPRLVKLMWSHKTQPAVVANFLMGITLLGDRSVVPELMKLTEEELDFSSTDSRAKAFLAATRLGGADIIPRSEAIMKKIMDQAIKMSPDSNKLTKEDEFEAYVNKMKELPQQVAKEKDAAKQEEMTKMYNDSSPSFWLANFFLDMKGNIKRLHLAKKCAGNVDCYIQALKSDDLMEQDKAAWEIAWAKSSAGIAPLIEALNVAANKRDAAVKPEDKFKYDSVRQSIMWALRLLAHEAEPAKAMKDKLKAQLEIEKLNKESIQQIIVVVDHTIGK